MKDKKTTTEYFTQWQDIKLSASSRRRMHSKLMEYVDFHAVVDDVRIPTDARSIHRTPRRTLLFKFTFMPYIILLAVMIGGGTSFAAQSSVPGDFLYPVKTEVNEPVRSVFAIGADAEASLQAKLVAERLREAEALEAEGEFSTAAAATIAANLRRHIAKANTALEKSTDGATLALGSAITLNLERFNTLVKNDASVAVDLATFGQVGADGRFSSSVATGEIDITELRAQTNSRLNNLSAVVADTQSEVSAEVHSNLTAKINSAVELSATAEGAAEASARQVYMDISKLLGEVESRLSTLGTLEIDSSTGAIIDVDFSRVPGEMSNEERNRSGVQSTISVRGSVSGDEDTAGLEIDVNSNLNTNTNLEGGEVDVSGAVRSGVSL